MEGNRSGPSLARYRSFQGHERDLHGMMQRETIEVHRKNKIREIDKHLF
jgi:hypothetical protein